MPSTNPIIHFDDYQAVIGLEIHVQLKTHSKLFSNAPNRFSHDANTHVSVIDLGMPGTLPVLNKRAVECGIRLGIALRADIVQNNRFVRKHYFYPDLPKGYQISQLEYPIIGNGRMKIDGADGVERDIDIERAHLEEDAGKLTHLNDRQSGVDYNRAGVPLIEVVTAPQMHSASEATDFMRRLHRLVRYLGVCSGNMERGALRCDANISLRPNASAPLGTRTELKNINSFRFVEKAINYEIERQRRRLEQGKKIIQETRLYDSTRDQTYSMRSKEDEQDYRYFPDPDLLSVRIDDEWIARVRRSIPLPPDQREKLWQEKHGLSAEYSRMLSARMELADYFDQIVDQLPERGAEAAAWIVREILPRLERAQMALSDSPVDARQLATVLQLLADKKLSGPMARKLFERMWQREGEVEELIEKYQFGLVDNQDQVVSLLEAMWSDHPDQVAQLKAGKHRVKGFFVGQIMRKTQGRADPALVNELLQKLLDDS